MTMTNEYIPVPESTDYPLWVPITDPKWLPGYEVSYAGEMRSPKGKSLATNRQSGNLYVSLRRADKSISSSRLDKLILTAFDGPAPEGKDVIVHKDGNADNCSIFNLAWGSGADAEPEAEPEAESYDFAKLAQDMKDVVWPSGISISEMDFTKRTYNILTRYHIVTAEELTLLTPDELMQMVGGGVKFVSEIQYKLGQWGFKLAEEPQPQPVTQPPFDEPAPKKQRRKRRTPDAPKGGGEVEVHRVYKLGNLQLSVNERGLGELSKKSRLTTADMAVLADLLQRAVEMNRIMGLK